MKDSVVGDSICYAIYFMSLSAQLSQREVTRRGSGVTAGKAVIARTSPCSSGRPGSGKGISVCKRFTVRTSSQAGEALFGECPHGWYLFGLKVKRTFFRFIGEHTFWVICQGNFMEGLEAIHPPGRALAPKEKPKGLCSCHI